MLRSFIAITLVAGLVGCSSEQGELVVVTYNAGLSTLFVDRTEERAPLVADAIGELDADVVCLQEVWDQRHVAAITAGFEHSIVVEGAQQLIPGECDAEALAPLASCVAAACTDPPDADCILGSCSPEFEAQEGECATCLATNLGGTLEEIQTACTTEAGRFQYDGFPGLVLLSRTPFTVHPHVDLGGTLSRRASIHATLDGGIEMLCTHLTAVEDMPYPGDAGSWEEDQREEIDILTSYIADAVGDAPLLLAGDLNTGPDEIPENFQRFLDIGLSSSFDGGCTFCADNPLVDDDARSVLIDHVLVRGVDATASRILDEPIEIDGQDSALSDHDGVRAVISLPE